MPRLSRFASLPRLLGAALAVGIGVVALWQAGIVFTSDKASITDASGQTVELLPANASLDTTTVAGRSVGLREGDVAPDFEFSAFDGQRLRLSDFRGRPVFLNFWASWCGPCRAEMPDIEVVLRDHEADGLAVIAVNNGERLQTAQRFLDRLDVEFTAFAYDPAASIVRRYEILGMPTSYFIDSQGVITGVYATALNQTLMRAAVQKAIDGAD